MSFISTKHFIIISRELSPDEVAKSQQQEHQHDIQAAVRAAPVFKHFLELSVGIVERLQVFVHDVEIEDDLLVGDLERLTNSNGVALEHLYPLEDAVEFSLNHFVDFLDPQLNELLIFVLLFLRLRMEEGLPDFLLLLEFFQGHRLRGLVHAGSTNQSVGLLAI